MDRIIEKKYKYSKKTYIAIGVALVFLILVLIIVFGDNSSKLNVEHSKITIESVKNGIFQDYIAVIGIVEPIKTIYLDAMEGGRVDEIIAEEGTMVKNGDVILKLSNTNLLSDVMFRESELAERENNLRTTRLQMEQNKLSIRSQLMEVGYKLKKQERLFVMNKKLFDAGHISSEEYQEQEDQYNMLKEMRDLLIMNQKQDSIFRSIQIEQLESSVKRMHENLKLIRLKAENLIVKAPTNGQLASIRPELGESMAPGARIGQINVLDGYKLRVDIDEHFISRIIKGLTAECEFSDINFNAHITKVYPEVINGRFAVDMEFDKNIPEEIRIGQTSRIRLELGESKKAIMLPKGGFYQSTGGQWVFVIDKSSNYAVKREIRIGRQNPKYYEVLEGLEEGEQVITSGYENFGDVDKLILQNNE
jgi:HlyD family secretion protein